MPMMIGNRRDMVRTPTGHTVLFNEAGEEKYVPDVPAVVKACMERGHAIKKDEPKVEPKEEEKKIYSRAKKPTEE